MTSALLEWIRRDNCAVREKEDFMEEIRKQLSLLSVELKILRNMLAEKNLSIKLMVTEMVEHISYIRGNVDVHEEVKDKIKVG